MIELYGFQQKASASIATRFVEYVQDPIISGPMSSQRRVPFFQALASLTGSGKTAILADAISAIGGSLEIAPVVLWLSKGKVVVEQSYANLEAGGKYHHLLGEARVQLLAEYNAREVADTDVPLLFFATVGTFNRKDKEEGALLIYKSDIDDADESTWEALGRREDASGARRPLIIVYDEAHNLSDQQTEILLELEPDAFLLASATMRLPAKLAAEVDELKRHGKTDEWLVTSVDTKAVADSGLVKKTIILAGYRTPMEETVSAMFADLRDAEAEAEAEGLEGRPKAIYVCQTNIVEGNAYSKDDARQPFHQRKAPPIVIWRYLTESLGVDPGTIAVYCSLAFVKDFPPPPDFVHFRGGDKDYSTFAEGDFQHVIFNLSLQEGWDDPLCYFAYIDKSMDSHVQVEQVIGRLLRQPGVRRYSAERLNTAHFYVRVDRNQVFNEMLDGVAAKLSADAPEIRFVKAGPGKQKPEKVAVKGDFKIPDVALVAKHAQPGVTKLVSEMTDYRGDGGTNVEADGERAVYRRTVGSKRGSAVAWETFKLSNRVSARWVFNREVRRQYPRAIDIVDLSQPKFDALVGISSNAYAHVVSVAAAVVQEYLENVELRQKRRDHYTVGAALARRDELLIFENAIHVGYDGLNGPEISFAQYLDEAGHPWWRNPPRSGYGIPLVSIGPTNDFYPDFIVWRGSTVIAIDTKGAHLLQEAAMRKLLRIQPAEETGERLLIRFVSEGRWSAHNLSQLSTDGFTVWGLKPDGTRRATHLDALEQVVERVLDPDPT